MTLYSRLQTNILAKFVDMTQHAYYSTRTLLTRCCTMCHCNEPNQSSKLGDRSKTQHLTLRKCSS